MILVTIVMLNNFPYTQDQCCTMICFPILCCHNSFHDFCCLFTNFVAFSRTLLPFPELCCLFTNRVAFSRTSLLFHELYCLFTLPFHELCCRRGILPRARTLSPTKRASRRCPWCWCRPKCS